MKQWVQKKYDVDLKKISEKYQVTEIFAEILVKRGLFDWEAINEYLFPALDKMHPSGEMKDLDTAAQIIRAKISAGKKIGVIGDYDVDGVMAVVILYLGLKEMGADVVWKIPHRVHDGYGIRDYMAEEMAVQGVDTLITCDNGISAGSAVDRAKELGMTVIVTDHHEVPLDNETGREILPTADAVIDIKQKGCAYPYKELCGSGVAYKLMEYLLGGECGEGLKGQLLSFAAIATVCDVVPLTGENRIIVKNGLEIMRSSENIGLSVLIRMMDYQGQLCSVDLGFGIGPCINAAGRLEDAAQAAALFLEQDEKKAEGMAQHLISLNEQRKAMTADAVEEAVMAIRERNLLAEPILVLYLKHCRESVAGIVAGRLREKYYRPVMVITDSEGKLKGSGRSIPGYHMQQALNRCSGLLLEYGGHAMAAGFSLEEKNLENLWRELNRNCPLKEADFVEKIFFDREVSLGEAGRELIRELELLQPIGEKNPGALFARRAVKVESVRIFGKEGQIGRFQAEEAGETYTLIDFNIHNHMKQTICEKYSEEAWEKLVTGQESCLVDILYVPEINARYGNVQYRVVDCR